MGERCKGEPKPPLPLPKEERKIKDNVIDLATQQGRMEVEGGGKETDVGGRSLLLYSTIFRVFRHVGK